MFSFLFIYVLLHFCFFVIDASYDSFLRSNFRSESVCWAGNNKVNLKDMYYEATVVR